MMTEVKAYNTVEVYVESKNASELHEEIIKLKGKGYNVSNVKRHYGKHGNESDRTYYVHAVKKEEVAVEKVLVEV